MRNLLGFLCVCAVGVFPLIGCGDNNDGDGGSGGTGGSAGMGGTGGTGGVNTASVTVLITGFDPAQGGFLGPLEGVEICIDDSTDCAMTDAAGGATLDVPVDQELSATFVKEGFAPYLIPAVISEQPEVFTLGMASLERWEFLHDLLTSPFPLDGTGDIIVVSDPGFAGATLDLSGVTGNLFYYGEDGNWAPGLTATTSYGWGGFTEASPGEAQVELGGTATNCEATTGWPGDVANSFRTPVRAGFFSEIVVSCDTP
ncbi:MAG: hypothetical protein WBM46_13830 [Polyangiales bacterium]